MKSLQVKRKQLRFLPDSSRVLAKLFIPHSKERIKKIINRILSLSEKERHKLLDTAIEDFSHRHFDLKGTLENNFEVVKTLIHIPDDLSQESKFLIGMYFTHEYSIQSAALFNPSIVEHPNQSGLSTDSVRFILSFRATGEGHISSIIFRSGVIDEQHNIIMDPISPFLEGPQEVRELGSDKDKKHLYSNTCYEEIFRKESDISERVIFPFTREERNGIEDARFVRFTDDNGDIFYYATYTAYNGRDIIPMLLETKDFLTFRMRGLRGKMAQGKGMALFPRKVNGKYTMISRQDGENLFSMQSEDLYVWEDKKLLYVPETGWELTQIGNCGSPVETEKGWLLLTHGVGPMRRYCIGAMLLDRNNPSQIRGKLTEPLLVPDENEREGYVPNVVYTCGAMLHRDELIIPYAFSDSSSGIASIGIDDLLKSLLVRKV